MITALAIMIAIAGYLNFTGSGLDEEELITTSAGTINDSSYSTVDESDSLEGINDLSGNETSSLEGITDLSDDASAMGDLSEEDLLQDSYADIDSLDTDSTVEASNYLDEGMAENTEELEDDVPGEAVFTSSSNVNTLSNAKLLKEQTRAKNKETLLEIINNTNISDEQKQSAIDGMIALTDTAQKETAAEVLLEAKGFGDVVVSLSSDNVDVMVQSSELSDAQRAQIEDIVKRKTGVLAENIVITPVSGD